jgi:hypothetical protein
MARSGCIYGSTGSRKSTQAKWLAHRVAAVTGKATYLLSMDGGGWGPCQPEIDAGMIQPFFCDPALVPLPTLRKISQGYWPIDPSAPANQVNLTQMDYARFGGLVVEGWTSITSAAMRYLPDKGINVGGEEREKLGGFAQTIQVDGQVQQQVFRSNTRGDYGFVQNYLYGFVMNCNSLPFYYVLHTALESKTEDDDRTTIFGPAISGKKATSQCGAWVGDLIHAQDYQVERVEWVPNPAKPAEKMEQKTLDLAVRFYYRKHPDPATGILFPAKPRVTPERVKELERAFPGGYFESDESGGFDRYLAKVDELAKGQADSLAGWRERMADKVGRSGTATSVAGPMAVTQHLPAKVATK